jgi:succinate dehydrogenase / fumarate reductase cytochrome b subunit
MSTKERPLSPHLQVYRPQLTSVLSILHRATGVALAAGLLLLVCWLLAVASGAAFYDAVQAFNAHWVGRTLLFGWSFALFFHLCNGIRHLAWDAGHGYEMDQVHRSGWLVVGASATLTVLAWIWGYSSTGAF